MSKNELLLDIVSLFDKARYATSHSPYKEKHLHKGIILQHFYKIEISGDDSWIIIDEYVDGEKRLHGISDSEKVLKEKETNLFPELQSGHQD